MSISQEEDRRRRSLIFVLDRQPEVCEFVRQSLESAGYRVQTFSRTDVYPEMQTEAPALVIVGGDIVYPANGVLPKWLFQASTGRKSPCIALLDHSSAEQQRMALEAGADECIGKPVSAHTLVSVVQRYLQHADVIAPGRSPNADIIIDSWAMKLSVRGVEIPTTALEFRLLEYLAHHRGQVFTRDFLLDAVWGDMRFINPRSVDACIRRVREKIEPDRTRPTMLKTIRGVGYRLDANTEWQSAPSAGCKCSACRSRESGLSLHAGGRQSRDSVRQ